MTATLMVTVTPGHEHDFGYRVTSTGFALHHCTLGGDTDVEDRVVSIHTERDYRVRLDMLEGMTRYRIIDHDEVFYIAHDAGPYHVDVKDGRTALTCECGWVGKYRHSSALRFLVQDQAGHRCPR